MLLLTTAARSAGPPVDLVLARAGDYAVRFFETFANVVAEERFVQDQGRRRSPNQRPFDVVAHRELVSDFLLVRLPTDSGWRAFRDVIRVDEKTTGNRPDRLADLLGDTEPSAAIATAGRIDRESIRYNIGDPARTLNNPLIVVGFLQPRYQSGFRFTVRDSEYDGGRDVTVVAYEERRRPTLLRRLPDSDLPAGGRIWIDSQTGAVLRSELRTGTDDIVTTRFAIDPEFGVAMPTDMRETYRYRGFCVMGMAEYSRFRRFKVRTSEQLR